MSWLILNKEWVFSGVGASAIIAIIGWFLNKRAVKNQPSQSITAGNNSYNIQGNDVKVHIGEKHDGR